MYERLTHRDSKGDVWIKDAAHVDEQGQICMLSDRLATYEDSGLSPEEVQKMARAKVEGRLVELPCKLGDTVYFAQRICEYKHCDTRTRMVCCGCSDYAKNKFVIQSRAFTLLDSKNIGKTVFLTREEAENALGGKDDV